MFNCYECVTSICNRQMWVRPPPPSIFLTKILKMNISTANGKLYIDNIEVATVVFRDGSVRTFPNQDSNSITIDSSQENTSGVKGDNNNIIQGKNIIAPGSAIKCKDFNLGDTNY